MKQLLSERKFKQLVFGFSAPSVRRLETEPSSAARAMLATLSALTATAIAFAVLGRLDIVVSGTGHLQQSQYTMTVQPLRSSIIRKIGVHDGDRVRKGQLLVLLDHDAEDAEIRRSLDQVKRDTLDLLRLRVLLAADEGQVAPRPAVPNGLRPAEAADLLTRIADQYAQQQTKVTSLRSQIAEKSEEAAETVAQLRQASDAVSVLSKEAQIRQESARLGVGSRIDELEIEARLVQQQDTIPQLMAHLRQAVASRDGLVAQLAAASADYRRTLWDDIEKSLADLDQGAADAEKARAAIAAQSLRSPCNGTVQQLTLTTPGGVVTSAQPVLSIVPEGSETFASLTVANKDVGFLRLGQEASVKVAAYPFNRYGLLTGFVSRISHDAATRAHSPSEENGTGAGPQQDGGRGSEADKADDSYIVQVSLRQNALSSGGKRLPLLPGMSVTADVLTGRRRVIDYLLSPVGRTLSESMRER